MPQRQGLQHSQQQQQVQNASSAQVLLSSLIEMPLADFETRLQNELLDNEALEVSDHEGNDGGDYADADGENYEAGDPLDDAVGDYRTLDDVPDNLREAYTNRGEDDRRERQIGAEETSYDDLYRQIGELNLTDHERAIMVYLVGSLDESGFLTKDDATLADELAFNEYIDTTPEEVARLARLLEGRDHDIVGREVGEGDDADRVVAHGVYPQRVVACVGKGRWDELFVEKTDDFTRL